MWVVSTNLAVRRESSFYWYSFVIEVASKRLKGVTVEGIDESHHAAVCCQQDRFSVRAERQ